MSHGTILMIDDDEKLTDIVGKYLIKQGWEVASAPHPDEGIRLIRDSPPRLVLLDVMLPEKDGFQTCREIRAFSDVPIIMLTARGEVTDRIVGLEVGADDYLSKPFEARELLARIQTVLRRVLPIAPEKTEAKVIRFGQLTIDVYQRTATLNGAPVDLTTAEFDILVLFAKHPGEVMDRNTVMDRLRGVDWQAFNRSIDVLISRIRQKLQDNPKRPTYFKTVWGVGYVFVAKPEK
jgi:DNA-binding response OmpR family regulator